MAKVKKTDEEQVAEYMATLSHPLKAVIEMLRQTIKNTDPNLSERIKWNAPSYHVAETDIVTFGPLARRVEEVMLVFHHPAIVQVASPLLEGSYKNRRLANFSSMEQAEASRGELQRILREVIGSLKEEA